MRFYLPFWQIRQRNKNIISAETATPASRISKSEICIPRTEVAADCIGLAYGDSMTVSSLVNPRGWSKDMNGAVTHSC